MTETFIAVNIIRMDTEQFQFNNIFNFQIQKQWKNQYISVVFIFVTFGVQAQLTQLVYLKTFPSLRALQYHPKDSIYTLPELWAIRRNYHHFKPAIMVTYCNLWTPKTTHHLSSAIFYPNYPKRGSQLWTRNYI